MHTSPPDRSSTCGPAVLRLAAATMLALGLIAPRSFAEQPELLKETITVPLTSPGQPGRLAVGINHGSVVVRGEARDDVLVVAGSPVVTDRSSEPDGLEAVPTSYLDLDLREGGNVVEITSHARRPLHLEITVPSRFDLELRIFVSSTAGVTVEGVSGLIEARTSFGDIELSRVSGSVVANSDYGDVVVALDSVDPLHPLSITSLQGDLDVTLPAGIGLTATIQSDVGSVHSAFEMETIRLRPKPAEPSAADGGFSMRVGGLLRHEINGGGTEATFKTLTGRIFLRRGATE